MNIIRTMIDLNKDKRNKLLFIFLIGLCCLLLCSNQKKKQQIVMLESSVQFEPFVKVEKSIKASDIMIKPVENVIVDMPIKKNKVLAKVTAYCPCMKCTFGTGITANRQSAWRKGVAADWSFLPEGSIVNVPGYGKSIIDDKGGLLKRKYWKKGIPVLDVRMIHHWQAVKWGKQYMYIEIVRFGH